ncbi:MAG TPA: EVE domain-containing protein [Myxococcota bacterium]|nr:EVE domain-containing protein [Myxococcota bacterium]
MARRPSHWLVKSEPGTYSWDDLVRDRTTRWDGVRNAQARNNLQAMQVGDLALFYHSGEGKEVVGVSKVVKAAYPDPTTNDERWVVVDLAPVAPLRQPVALADIKRDAALADLALVRQGRLSVMPIDPRAFARILALGKTKL